MIKHALAELVETGAKAAESKELIPQAALPETSVW